MVPFTGVGTISTIWRFPLGTINQIRLNNFKGLRNLGELD